MFLTTKEFKSGHNLVNTHGDWRIDFDVNFSLFYVNLWIVTGFSVNLSTSQLMTF